MTRHQLRLLLCAVGALALMAYSLFAIEWFRIAVESHASGAIRFQVDLQSASACFSNGACANVPLSRFQGWYPAIAAVTFYGSCALACFVVYQAGSRFLRGTSTESLSKLGYFVAVVCFAAAGLTGYLFPPDAAPHATGPMAIVSVTVVRTWAPAVLLLAHATAFVALHFSVAEELSRPTPAVTGQSRVRRDAPVLALLQDSKPGVTPRPSQDRLDASAGSLPSLPESIVARAKTRSSAPSISDPRAALALAAPRGVVATAVEVGRASQSTGAESADDFLVVVEDEDKMPAIESAIAELAIESLIPPTPRLPTNGLGPPEGLDDPQTTSGMLASIVDEDDSDELLTVKAKLPFATLRGKLNFATMEIALSTRGIDAQREDGMCTAVAWDDVVGVVARRLPPMQPYGGETFVDVVSTAGATLRILPWTQLTGEAIVGANGDVTERARAIVQLVASRCPEAQLDNATRSFLGGRGQAAQLPSAELLARHDERLS